MTRLSGRSGLTRPRLVADGKTTKRRADSVGLLVGTPCVSPRTWTGYERPETEPAWDSEQARWRPMAARFANEPLTKMIKARLLILQPGLD